MAAISHSKDVSWYAAGPPTLPADIKELLSKWSGVDPSDLEKHVETIVCCTMFPGATGLCADYLLSVIKPGKSIHILAVGGYRFLVLGLAMHPSFNAIATSLKADEDSLFLDLGCCVGQDLRSLAQTGVPGKRLAGVDLESSFTDIGYDLFCDKDRLGAQFFFGDIMTLDGTIIPIIQKRNSMLKPNADTPSHPLNPLLGRVSILWASAFLHLWPLSGQTTLCKNILKLMQIQPGVRILGRHVGSETPSEKVHVTNHSGLMYQHNPETFRKMWAEALGHEGDVREDGMLSSARYGSWELKCWFEEDDPSVLGNGLDWLAKVGKESEGESARDEVFKDRKIMFLIWELERKAHGFGILE